jgi:hypothetical protein
MHRRYTASEIYDAVDRSQSTTVYAEELALFASALRLGASAALFAKEVIQTQVGPHTSCGGISHSSASF